MQFWLSAMAFFLTPTSTVTNCRMCDKYVSNWLLRATFLRSFLQVVTYYTEFFQSTSTIKIYAWTVIRGTASLTFFLEKYEILKYFSAPRSSFIFWKTFLTRNFVRCMLLLAENRRVIPVLLVKRFWIILHFHFVN